MPPKISLLILNYNGKEITAKLLDSIKKVSYPQDKIETIVIDNNSSDGSVAFFRKNYPFAKILRMKQNLAYGAFNIAVKQCTGEYCFILNNDMELDKDCLQHLVKTFQDHPDCVITAPALYEMESRKLAYTRKYLSRTFYQGADHFQNLTEKRSENTTKASYTGVPCLKTSFAQKLDYIFDPDYFLFMEDIDLGYRIWLMGHTFYRSPKAKAYHEAHSTTKKEKSVFTNKTCCYLIERNSLQTYLKNLQWWNIILYSPLYLTPRLTKLFIYMLTLNTSLFSAIISAWKWNIIHLDKTLSKRKRIQQVRKRSDRQIFQQIGGEFPTWRYILAFKKQAVKS